jgi:putative oxygen-independent coproporphyrinogen III oxidase
VKIKVPPLALYIHLPWCVRKCPYCDFNSHTAGDNAPRGRYVAAILADIALEGERAAGRQISSIFLGGGTPSLFAPQEIGQILAAAQNDLNVAGDCEITLEANPGTVERGDLAAFRHAGVNRLSLGAQSFNESMLEALGRIHGPADIYAAYDQAAAAGFASVNIDLMFALPGQTLRMAIDDIEEICRLQPPHVSYYQLTLEPNTVFFERPPENLPDDELSWEIQEQGLRLLRQAGYQQYEISAFAREGHRCRHNLNYWTFGDYLAVGAGAHGKYTGADGVVRRYRKPAHPLTYIEQMLGGTCQPAMQALQEQDLGFEYLLNALRLRDGFSAAAFSNRTGLGLEAIAAPLRTAQADGLIRESAAGVWQATPLGFRFLNDLQARFLP